MNAEDIKIGMKVRYYPVLGHEGYTTTEITSVPWDLCGETVCKIKARSGGVSIDHLEPVTEPATAR